MKFEILTPKSGTYHCYTVLTYGQFTISTNSTIDVEFPTLKPGYYYDSYRIFFGQTAASLGIAYNIISIERLTINKFRFTISSGGNKVSSGSLYGQFLAFAAKN